MENSTESLTFALFIVLDKPHKMVDEVRLRSACDRCHSHKLRCPKQPDESSCQRCSRARVTCTFSPFRQKKGNSTESDASINQHEPSNYTSTTGGVKRRRTTEVTPQPGIISLKYLYNAHMIVEIDTPINPSIEFTENGESWINDPSTLWDSTALGHFPSADFTFGNLEMNNESSFLNYEQMIPEISQCQTQEMYNPIQPPDGTNQSRTFGPGHDEVSPSFWNLDGQTKSSRNPELKTLLQAPSTLIRRLSELSVNLFAVGEKMPPQSIHESLPNDQEAELGHKDYSDFSLEEMFNSNQELIDIYPPFMETFIESRPGQKTSNTSPIAGTDTISTHDCSPQETSKSDNRTTPREPKLDHSSILLMLSVHLRLINIWEQLLKHVAICVRQKGLAKTPAQAAAKLKIPTLKIGGFSPPPSVLAPMYMVMFLSYSKKLYNHAKALTTKIQLFERKEATDPNPDWNDAAAISLKTASDVKTRANALNEELNEINETVVTSGLLADLCPD